MNYKGEYLQLKKSYEQLEVRLDEKSSQLHRANIEKETRKERNKTLERQLQKRDDEYFEASTRANILRVENTKLKQKQKELIAELASVKPTLEYAS